MDTNNWTPGMPGKGAVMNDGTILTWNYNGDLNDAVHLDVITEAGWRFSDSLFNFYIEPDATVHAMEGEVDPYAAHLLSEEGFNVETPIYDENTDWTASVSAPERFHKLNWSPGGEGKGVVGEDGRVHTWDSDEWDTHEPYLQQSGEWPEDEDGNRDVEVEGYFAIEPNGQVYNAGLGGLAPGHVSMIEEADPHLFVKGDGAYDWQEDWR